MDIYKDLLAPGEDEAQRTNICNSIIYGTAFFVLNAQGALLNVYLVELLQRKIVSDPAKCFIITNIITSLTAEVSGKLGSIVEIGKGLAASEMMFKLLDIPSKIDALETGEDGKPVGADTSDVIGKIEFRDVWFRYPTRKEEFVLRGLSLTINPGESVALVGESGCGKSTFINLMMRFYDPQFGEIFLDDKNIKDYNVHQLREKVSLVMQEPVLFNYTITDNILYGNLDATNKEVLNCADAANATDFIME